MICRWVSWFFPLKIHVCELRRSHFVFWDISKVFDPRSLFHQIHAAFWISTVRFLSKIAWIILYTLLFHSLLVWFYEHKSSPLLLLFVFGRFVLTECLPPNFHSTHDSFWNWQTMAWTDFWSNTFPKLVHCIVMVEFSPVITCLVSVFLLITRPEIFQTVILLYRHHLPQLNFY